jgi:transmembrane sensor
MNPNLEEGKMPPREEQAGEWCVRLSTGSLLPPEQAAFDAWMTADPTNTAAFDQALTVWQGLHAISDSPEVISQRADALDALRRANRKRWSRRLVDRWQWSLGIAASLLLVIVSSLWLFAARPQEYATGMGERRAFLLSDGSHLSLDAKTRVAVRYEPDHRELTLLSGRAKFDVANDPARPFTVTAGDRTVIATGTAFSVELLGKQVRVIVYEGHVAVVKGAPPPPQLLLRIKERPGTTATGLSPGDELITDLAPSAPLQVVEADVARSLAWEAGQLNLVDEPLGSSVERLNRYSPNKIVVGDARAAAIRVNGVFNAGDSAAFLEALAEAYPVHAERNGNDVVIRGIRSMGKSQKTM